MFSFFELFFPQIGMTRRPFVSRLILWCNTAAVPLLLLFQSAASVIFLATIVPTQYTGILGLLSFLIFLVILVWGTKRVLSFLENHPIWVQRLTRVNPLLVFVLVSFSIFFSQEVVSVYLVGRSISIGLIAALVSYFLGRLHRQLLVVSEDTPTISELDEFIEHCFSVLTGFNVPSWIKMHYRYFRFDFYVWILLFVFPGMVFAILVDIGLKNFSIFLTPIFNLDNFNPNMWTLVSVIYLVWGIVIYNAERYPKFRFILVSIFCGSMIVWACHYYFFDPDFDDESLGIKIASSIFISILLILGYGSVYWALESSGDRHYENGASLHMEKKYTRSVEYLEWSSDEGNAKASFLLGEIFELGQGHKVDLLRAAKNYHRACKGRVPGAEQKFQEVLSRLPETQKSSLPIYEP